VLAHIKGSILCKILFGSRKYQGKNTGAAIECFFRNSNNTTLLVDVITLGSIGVEVCGNLYLMCSIERGGKTNNANGLGVYFFKLEGIVLVVGIFGFCGFVTTTL
jgi:hypothetical protein